MGRIEDNVRSLIESKINNLGYLLVNIHYFKENGDNYLRITVDKDSDISLDDIVYLSDLISPLLDANDVINDKYILDITSLGVEKEIMVCKLPNYLNKYLNVHLSHPFKGLNNIIGTLIKVDTDSILMEINDKGKKRIIALNKEHVDKVHLAIKF